MARPSSSFPRRSAWLTLAGVAVALVLAALPAAAPAEDPTVAGERPPSARGLAPLTARPTAAVPLPAASLAPSLLAGAVQPLAPTDRGAPSSASLSQQLKATAKKLEQKQQALAKQQAKQDAAGALLAELLASLAAAEQALADALALPATTEEEIAERNAAIQAATKALAKVQKQVARQEQKLDKLGAGLAKLDDLLDALADKLESLEDRMPGELPPAGLAGLLGLELPDRVDVITAGDDDTAGLSAPPGDGGSPVDGFPPDADYFTDPSHAWVHDLSTESLDTVNSILCLMGQTASDELVNEGAYLAQIDNALCDTGGEQAGGNGGAPQDSARQFELWTVDSRRETETGRHFVGVWVPNEGHPNPEGPPEPPSTIHVLVEIEEPESEAHPFGVFEMDFAGLPTDGGAEPLFWGTLDTAETAAGQMGFRFFQEGGKPKDKDLPFWRTQVLVEMAVDGSGGAARVRETFRKPSGTGGPGGGLVTQEFLLAFDDSQLLRAEVGGETTCLSRVELTERVWRANLYHASGDLAGQRVELQSGMGVQTAAGEPGWIGYHGLWFDDDVTVESGDVVLAHDPGAGPGAPPEEFTVYQAPGKLWERLRSELLLTDLGGESFEWWAFPAGGPLAGPSELFLIEYDLGEAAFVLRARVVEGTPEDLPPDEQLPVDRELYPWLSLWSASLGGMVQHLDGEPAVQFFEERVVDASHPALAGGDLTLYGLVDCLRAGLSGADAEAGDVFLPDSFDPGAPHVFRFDADDLVLEHDTWSDGSSFAQVGLLPGETYAEGPFAWGLRGGPLVTSLDGVDDPHDLFQAEVSFLYETGPNPWNRYTTLVDGGGGLLAFDAPIQFTYTHSVENDRNGDATWAGKTFQLEYAGDGQLHGIPHEEADLDGDGHPDRWFPRFSLADGVLLGARGDYVLKAIEVEQTLGVTPGGCEGLNADAVADLPLPDDLSFGFPAIGPAPAVTDPPAVIAGVVQGG